MSKLQKSLVLPSLVATPVFSAWSPFPVVPISLLLQQRDKVWLHGSRCAPEQSLTKMIDQWRSADSRASFRSGSSCSSSEAPSASLLMIQSNWTPLSNPHSDSESSTPETHKERLMQNRSTIKNTCDDISEWLQCFNIQFHPSVFHAAELQRRQLWPAVKLHPLCWRVWSEHRTLTLCVCCGNFDQNHCRSERRRASLTT